MKYLLIVNPMSGDRSGLKKIRFVTRYFARKGDKIEVRLTEYPGHAAEIAGECCDKDFDFIIGAGGDGTINEVLNGLIGKFQKLAILPWGTGNVFAREMNFPIRLKSACKMIRKGKSIRLDAGRSNGHYFLLMAGAGFDAYSLRQLGGDLKKNLGIFAYAVGVLKAFSRYRYPEIEVTLGNGEKDKGSFVLVSNTSRYGAFFSFSPKALSTDGLLDVFVFRETGTWSTLKMLTRLLMEAIGWLNPAKRTPFLKKIGSYKTSSLTITSSDRVLTQLDGELSAPLPSQIEIHPKAVEIILPGKTVKRYKKKKKKFFRGKS
jgi:diacylglycerol kinase (ATP)